MNTLDYYNHHAQDFINNTLDADVSKTINPFMQKVVLGGRILDVGCGAGRDTETFLRKGYEVVAFDASKELCTIVQKRINHPIVHQTIQEMTWSNEFDGVWAMASLLHLKKSEMKDAFSKCINALKPEGVFFACFKEGLGEGYDSKGRFFSYYKQDELSEILKDIPGVESIDFIPTEDNLGREISWLNFIVKKSPELNLTRKNKIR